jgi:hypothetical protein
LKCFAAIIAGSAAHFTAPRGWATPQLLAAWSLLPIVELGLPLIAPDTLPQVRCFHRPHPQLARCDRSFDRFAVNFCVAQSTVNKNVFKYGQYSIDAKATVNNSHTYLVPYVISTTSKDTRADCRKPTCGSLHHRLHKLHASHRIAARFYLHNLQKQSPTAY